MGAPAFTLLIIRRTIKMANRSSNRAAVPEAKGALDKFKYEVASELGVPLTVTRTKWARPLSLSS